jgi:hypothetical protein
MTTVASAAPSMLGVLARQEIRNYLRSKLFWLGSAGVVALAVAELIHTSSGGDGIIPAALIGLLGISIMAGMVRRSDQAAAAAGAVGVSQRTRTLALACAVVVPATVGLLWFACSSIGYYLHPPSPNIVPFPGTSDFDVLTTNIHEGVMPCIGGPVLGLVIGRWLPNRAAAPLISVLIVPITMVMQPLPADFAPRWHMVWIWTHMIAPYGVPGDPNRFAASPGSPQFYVLYLAGLCVLGVLFALYRDREADRTRLRTALWGALAATVALGILAIVVGPDHYVPNPLPSPEYVKAH